MTPEPGESLRWRNVLEEALDCDFAVDLVGVGNDIRQDDALGLEISSRLRSRMGRSPGRLKVHRPTQMPERLISKLASTSRRVVIFDAVETSKPPGTIVCSKLGDTKYGFFATHNVPLKLVPGLEERLGDFYVVGVQPERLEVGEGLSAIVDLAVDKIVDYIASREGTKR
jgi:hydrogenase maturation protease